MDIFGTIISGAILIALFLLLVMVVTSAGWWILLTIAGAVWAAYLIYSMIFG